MLFKHFGRNLPLHFRLSLALVLSWLPIPNSLQAQALQSSTATVWLGPDGSPLPFSSQSDVLDFLATAEMTAHERVGEGINNPYKVTLERNGVTAHACFRDVRVWEQEAQLGNELKLLFRDDAIFEVAAYRLAYLLGMQCIPPAVERTLLNKKGSLQLWIENAFSDKDRLARELKPTDLSKWRCQYQAMLIFDSLIANEDRNQGNILFDSEWNRWLIDHTRAFRIDRRLLHKDLLKQCPSSTWKHLHELDLDLLQAQLGPYLSPREIRAILLRRDLLLEHYQGRIDKWGEGAVLAADEY